MVGANGDAQRSSAMRSPGSWPPPKLPSSAPAWAAWPPPARFAGRHQRPGLRTGARSSAAIGAGIQMLPNSMKVLRGIGDRGTLRAHAFAPYSHLNRVGDTGEVKRELPMPEDLYGAPFLCMHRADLHEALTSIVPSDIIHCNKKLVGLEQNGGPVTLTFADGTTAKADAGDRRRRRSLDRARHHHRTRQADPPRPHRLPLVFKSNLMPKDDLDARAPNGGATDRHIVIYYTAKRPQPALLRHQRAGAGGLDHRGILVGQGRRQGTARGLCRLPSRGANGARRLPGLPQMGDPGARAAADLERGQGRAAG